MSNSNKLAEIKLYYKPLRPTKPKICSALEAYTHSLNFYNKDTLALQEQFVVLYLNRANSLIGGYLCSTGGITGTVADIRLILGTALKSCACGLIVSHNHPSGNLEASAADRALTNKISEACKLMDIKLLDHLIISPFDGEYISFAETGLL